jgi:hypothetical protein
VVNEDLSGCSSAAVAADEREEAGRLLRSLLNSIRLKFGTLILEQLHEPAFVSSRKHKIRQSKHKIRQSN